MVIRRHINNYNFIADQDTGMTFRWGKTFNENPKLAPVPELVDISISNHCSKGCDFCYRNSKPNNTFMTVEDYIFALKSLNHPEHGNVFQVALGGGEPLEHPNFLEIINITQENNIVPNFTTNGIYLTDKIVTEIKGKVGAVAVSISNIEEIVSSNINLLIKHKLRTNIHYVVDNKNIKQAIKILNGEFNSLLTGVNAIVFLTYKPSGRGTKTRTLKLDDKLKEFISLIDKNNSVCSIGFDACFVPLLMYLTNTRKEVIDFCEVGFFSVYIDEKLNVSPCSFSNGKDAFNLKEFEFYDIWNNKFSKFRNSIKSNCNQECSAKQECKGKCPYYPEITVCYKN